MQKTTHRNLLTNTRIHRNIAMLLLAACGSSAFSANWGDFKKESCNASGGTRKYSSILWNIPWGASWEDACRTTPATIDGVTYMAASCTTSFNEWGHFNVPDASCTAPWNVGFPTYFTEKDDGCQSGARAGQRKYSSRIWNVSGSWENTCADSSNAINGFQRRPDNCVNTGATGEWGEWFVPDSTCQATRPQIIRGAEDNYQNPAILSGYADLHTHLMSSLGFGGTTFLGTPYGHPALALQPDFSDDSDPQHARVHSAVERILQGDLLGGLLATPHPAGGYNKEPFYWPNFNSPTHQTMYQDWIQRAYEGGMRVMVALAANGDFMFGGTDNGLPVHPSLGTAKLPYDDSSVLAAQTAEVSKMVNYIDQQYGGTGNGWFQIAKSPADINGLINKGKLAVILGTEVDYLFGCKRTPWPNTSPCTDAQIVNGVQSLYDSGIRVVFPVHLKTNGFAGAAIYNPLVYAPNQSDCVKPSKCNDDGLTAQGVTLVKELMKKGIIIDIGHMSAKTMEAVLKLAEQARYPGIMSGHTGVYDISHESHRTEANITTSTIKRIMDLGGMIGLIAGQGNLNDVGEFRSPNPSDTMVPNECGHSSATWAQSYLYTKYVVGNRANDGRITIGTDLNGFAEMPGPRFGPQACFGGQAPNRPPLATTKVTYPFRVPDSLIPAQTLATKPDRALMPLYKFGGHTYDFNSDGMAHMGLVPDFFEDLRQQGFKKSDLEPVYRSAGYFSRMWQGALNVAPSIR